jgi:hypothetical protein
LDEEVVVAVVASVGGAKREINSGGEEERVYALKKKSIRPEESKNLPTLSVNSSKFKSFCIFHESCMALIF